MIVASIKNRTENWKTAKTFVPLKNSGLYRLARILGEEEAAPQDQIRMQLFWKGMRDHRHQDREPYSEEGIAERFNRLFPNLRDDVAGHVDRNGRKFEILKPDNYLADTEDRRKRLLSNLLHTEIDIVAESKTRLFIGEAKNEMGLDANRELILVHQLIRQYVMAKILLEILGCCKNIVPFVVVGTKRNLQVDFLIRNKDWLKESNVLEWKSIRNLRK